MRPRSLVDSSYHYLPPGLLLGIEVADITVCEFIMKSSFTHFVFSDRVGNRRMVRGAVHVYDVYP